MKCLNTCLSLRVVLMPIFKQLYAFITENVINAFVSSFTDERWGVLII